jgi:hypothetical protein
MSSTAQAIYSLDNGSLHLLPASGLADSFLPLGSGDQSSDNASVRPPGGESLFSAFVERAKRPTLGPLSLEQRQ